MAQTSPFPPEYPTGKHTPVHAQRFNNFYGHSGSSRYDEAGKFLYISRNPQKPVGWLEELASCMI
ncbi:MAG: hypothetical protein PHC98_01910 [Syntrophotalea acetylenica]|jgi:hypothetical protein|nr:hypothetical protein [Syntrophotalea acetylenica]